MPYSTPLMFTSIIRSHSSILSRSSGACGIRPALLSITSMRPQVCTAVYQRLDLLAAGNIGRNRDCLAAACSQLLCQRLKAIGTARPQHDSRALGGKKSGSRLAQTAAGARDDNDFVLDCFGHGSDLF